MAYEGKIKASIRENRYFDFKQEAFQIFSELSKWYLSLEDVKRKKSFERDERTVRTRNTAKLLDRTGLSLAQFLCMQPR